MLLFQFLNRLFSLLEIECLSSLSSVIVTPSTQAVDSKSRQRPFLCSPRKLVLALDFNLQQIVLAEMGPCLAVIFGYQPSVDL